MHVSKQVLVRLDRLLTFPGLSARLLTLLRLASSQFLFAFECETSLLSALQTLSGFYLVD